MSPLSGSSNVGSSCENGDAIGIGRDAATGTEKYLAAMLSVALDALAAAQSSVPTLLTADGIAGHAPAALDATGGSRSTDGISSMEGGVTVPGEVEAPGNNPGPKGGRGPRQTRAQLIALAAEAAQALAGGRGTATTASS